VTLRNKVHSCEFVKSWKFELLFLRIVRSRLLWFGHVTRMSQKIGEAVLLAVPTQESNLQAQMCSQGL